MISKTGDSGMCMEGDNSPGISFEGVSLSFEGRQLFEDLSFQVEGGLCTCILGPSGCGKSTLLKLASKNPELHYTGEIRFSGTGESAPAVAWMAQKDLLLPWMTIKENVLLGARLRGEVTDALREKAVSLIGKAGLGEYENALPEALSGGMRQRVALLRTLMEDRQVILMDEPFSALDALTRIKLQDLTSGLIKGATVLLVTHDPMEALRMGDMIYVMSGDPVHMGTPMLVPGTPPRDSGDPELIGLYSGILKDLLGGDVS